LLAVVPANRWPGGADAVANMPGAWTLGGLLDLDGQDFDDDVARGGGAATRQASFRARAIGENLGAAERFNPVIIRREKNDNAIDQTIGGYDLWHLRPGVVTVCRANSLNHTEWLGIKKNNIILM